MAPRNAEAWSDANTLKFVMLIAYALGGSPAEHWGAIAEKMGPGYTATALASKWQRLRAQVAKEGGVGGASDGTPAPATPARKRKAAAPKTPKSSKKARNDSANEDDVEEGNKSAEKSEEKAESVNVKGEEAEQELEEGEI